MWSILKVKREDPDRGQPCFSPRISPKYPETESQSKRQFWFHNYLCVCVWVSVCKYVCLCTYMYIHGENCMCAYAYISDEYACTHLYVKIVCLYGYVCIYFQFLTYKILNHITPISVGISLHLEQQQALTSLIFLICWEAVEQCPQGSIVLSLLCFFPRKWLWEFFLNSSHFSHCLLFHERLYSYRKHGFMRISFMCTKSKKRFSKLLENKLFITCTISGL